MLDLAIPKAIDGKDIEGVHKTRVGFRRIRTLLKVLKSLFTKNDVKYLRRESKELGFLLGQVRDLDVFCLNLKQYLIKNTPLIDFESEIWQPYFADDYKNARSHLLYVLKSQNFNQFLNYFENFCNIVNLGVKNKILINEELQNSLNFISNILFTQFSKTQDFQEKLFNHLDAQDYHKLRIKFKEFRYTLEFFTPILNPNPTSFLLEALVSLQDYLGTMNDFVTANKILEKTLNKKNQSASQEMLIVLNDYKTYVIKENFVFQSNFSKQWESYQSMDPKGLLDKIIPNQ